MKKKIIIVDAVDRVLSHKQYIEVDFKNEIYRISRMWVIDKKGNILLQKRSSNVSFNKNKWAFAAGGTNDEGETYESNIIKEAKEEIGLVIKDPKRLQRVFCKESERQYFCSYYICELESVKPLINFDRKEVHEVSFFTAQELNKLLEVESYNFAEEIIYARDVLKLF